MPVSAADVAAAAALARLHLEPDEADRLADELESILAHVEILAGAEGDPTASAAIAGDPSVLREDVPAVDALRDTPDTMAPAWRDGYFTVPRLAAQRGEPDHE